MCSALPSSSSWTREQTYVVLTYEATPPPFLPALPFWNNLTLDGDSPGIKAVLPGLWCQPSVILFFHCFTLLWWTFTLGKVFWPWESRRRSKGKIPRERSWPFGPCKPPYTSILFLKYNHLGMHTCKQQSWFLLHHPKQASMICCRTNLLSQETWSLWIKEPFQFIGLVSPAITAPFLLLSDLAWYWHCSCYI